MRRNRPSEIGVQDASNGMQKRNENANGSGEIDFVLLWVDGSDSEWQASKRLWKKENGGPNPAADPEKDEQNGALRYRDNGLLRYWFRAVEQFAPWVHCVFFVTYGQKPAWLDESYPKLRLVSHAEFMPPEYLPTFNCNPIHFCLHHIPDLAEHFVLFDDDMFLLRPVGPETYFHGGFPVLDASLRPMGFIWDRHWLRTIHNNTYEINSHFDMHRQVRANRGKWFDLRALGALRASTNFVYWLLNGKLPGKDYGHLPLPHLKSTFGDLWQSCPETLERTCRSRFRSHDQVSQWLATAWNLATGRFHPTARPHGDGSVLLVDRTTVDAACSAIRTQKFPQVCLNDSIGTDESIECFSRIRHAFDEILPGKSPFEKD